MDISALNLSESSETGFEFEYIPESTGIGEGVFITVIGKHADKVKEWSRKALNDMRGREAMLIKKGKDDFRKIEEDESFGIKQAAVTITGWRGISDGANDLEYSAAMAVTLCTINPEIRTQVMAASEQMSNFTKSK
jgi:hypothetical protein